VTRGLAALLGSLLLAGAAPLPVLRLAALPLPPPLPARPPVDEAAPVPDADVQAPDAMARGPAVFAVRVYPMREFGTSDGFIPGSAYQSPEQRKPVQTPGFMVTLPLR